MDDQWNNDMTMRKVLMTPEWASRLLSRNEHNRKIRRESIRDYINQILSGEWKLTHQGIAVAKSGRLIDGQHRLTAIVKTGISVPVCLFEHCDEESFDAIDRGAKRSISDALCSNKAITQPLSVLVELCNIVPVRPSHVSRLLESKFGKACEGLHLACNTNRASATTASIRAGAIARIISSGNAQYVEAQYRNFVLLEYSAMADSVLQLEKQIASGKMNSTDRAACVVRAYKAFNPDCGRMAKLIIGETESSKTLEEIRALVLPIIKTPAE